MSKVDLCVYGADPGALARDSQTAPSLLIAYDDGRRYVRRRVSTMATRPSIGETPPIYR